MVNTFLIFICKIIFVFSKTFNLGAGSTWPGHIALSLNPNFIEQIISRNNHLKIVLIAGTNGKTTTSKLIQFILEKSSLKVFHNKAGANLLNGITSTLIQNSNIAGKLNYDAAIFEVDENTLPLLLRDLKPSSIIILNLFRDQLDRYGEVNIIANKWKEALLKLDENNSVYLNGDDPLIAHLGNNLKIKCYYFGIDKNLMKKREIPHDVDSIYCPNCMHKLTYNAISYSHLGDFKCTSCGFKREKVETYSDKKINYPLLGIYNIYNTNAVIALAINSFNIPIDKIKDDLAGFKPAFGRQEILDYKGRKIMIFLSKNPTGFNQSIETINSQNSKSKNILFVLNDRIPDGRDISWIWDIDIEDLVHNANNIVISGDRAYDMALRVKYTLQIRNPKIKVYEIMKEAIKTAVKETGENETLFVLPTYSAMLEVRKILKGRSIL